MPVNILRRACITVIIVAISLISQVGGGRVSAQTGATPSERSTVPPGQPLRFERFTIDDGLSQNTVFAILQDHQGYIWTATQEGLNRYDGYAFTHFKHDPRDENSLSISSVLAIHEDSSDLLWFGTWGGGLDRFDPHTNQFTHFTHDPDNPASLGNDTVTAVLEDRQNRLWVATCGGGLNLLDRETGTFTRHTHDPNNPTSISSDNVSALFEDASGALWVGTGCFGIAGNGLNRFDSANGQFKRFEADPADPEKISSENISTISQDEDGFLWVGTGGYALTGAGLVRLDPQTGKMIRYQNDPANPDSLSADRVMGLMVDSSGMLWVGSWGGGLDLAQPNLETGAGNLKFHHQRNNPYNPQSISSDIVWSFLEDHSGVIWVGTANGGINKLNPQVQQFGLYRNDPTDPDSLSHNAVGPMLEDRQGRIWIGTLGTGLELFERSSGNFTHFSRQKNDPLSHPGNAILAIYEDRPGTLWLGSMGGLASFDPTSSTFTEFRNDPANPDSLVNDGVSSVVEDDAGRLWVGTLTGLDWFDRDSGRFIHMQIPDLASVFSMHLDRDGYLWVGSWGQGIFRLDLNTVKGAEVAVIRYSHDPEKPDSLAHDSVFFILQDHTGTLWVGTQSGLDRFDAATQTFSHFQEPQGLINNTILCMREDQGGRLWISTNGGMSRFDPLTQTFRNFDSTDGLQSNEFDSGACGLTRAGEMYFGGQHGLTVFRPEDIRDNPTPPPVELSAFRVFNDPVTTDLSGAVPIQLSYIENFIAFEFVALDFHAPQKNQYAYQLVGFDKDWVNAGTRRYASYTNLRGGEYTFRVKAANNNGIWNDTGISIPIHITPPIWEVWWFRLAGILAVLGVIALGVRVRLQSVREHNRRLEMVVYQRTLEISEANQRLESEVEQRKRAEAALAQQAAEELRQSETRFKAVFENTIIGMGFLSLDRRITDANPAIELLSGYSREELLSINPTSLVWPEDRLLDADLFRELVNGERDGYTFEKRYQHKNGGKFWGRLNYTLVRDSSGAPSFIFGILENIDEEKHSQEELRLSEARFRAMFDNLAVGMALMSLDRKIIQINQTAEKIVGYSVEEMRNLNPAHLAIPEDRLIDQDLFQDIVNGRIDQYQVEKRYVHKDGHIFWGRVNFSLVRGDERKPQYIIGLIEDIDEEKRVQEKLNTQEAEYRRTLELRVTERTAELRQANEQLQNAIEQRQRAETALAQKAAEEAVVAERTRLARDLHDAVTQTLFSASLLAEVIPQLWDINPAEAQKRLGELRELTRGALAEMRTLLLELRPSALTDAALPDLLRQLSEAIIGRARIPIDLAVDGSFSLPPEVQVAMYRIAQEALNNVVKYARANQVSINLRFQEETVRLSIMDNGIGFNPAAVPPNHLGLRIMRERAEAIGARLSIYSEPGEGTQVTVVWNPPAAAKN